MSKLAQAKTDLRFFRKMVSENERRLSYRFIPDRDRSETEKELKQLKRLVTYTETYIKSIENVKNIKYTEI